jgi:hypothetical protein
VAIYIISFKELTQKQALRAFFGKAKVNEFVKCKNFEKEIFAFVQRQKKRPPKRGL